MTAIGCVENDEDIMTQGGVGRRTVNPKLGYGSFVSIFDLWWLSVLI